MFAFIKKLFLSFKRDFALFAALSAPGLIFYFFGLYQLNALSGSTVVLGATIKFISEFCALALLINLFSLIGFKKRPLLALALFLYYLTIIADIVLLAYFQERFSLKYVSTLEGGQYKFLLEFRWLAVLSGVYLLCYFIIRKFWHESGTIDNAVKIAVSAIILFCIPFISPFSHMKSQNAFFASRLTDTALAVIIKDIGAQKIPHRIIQYSALPANVKAQAGKYGLFRPSRFQNVRKYDRIVLITAEAFSNKFINSFNPAIPKEASTTIDSLIKKYPFVSLKSVTLSTLYGLSVVISGHPNAELSFKNGFPLSFPRILKDNGFKTAFIRGAKEDYMNEDKIFNSAGFEEIYGAKYFARQAAYSPFVAWWGLTDRKLFDFAVEYLKRHKNDKVFINLMTVDTHVPLGRDDYLGQEYPALNGKNIPEDITNLYKNVNMARAFFRFDYDLNLFIENLKKEGLLDGRTLLVITGDHPVYANMDAGILFKDYKPVFDELPLILITEKPIEERAAGGNLLSQQDIAPTILALAGFAAPRGMFGRSVFENAPRAAFNVKDGYALITASDGSVKFLSSNSKEPQEKALTELINTIIVD